MRFFDSILRKTHASDKQLREALKNIFGYYPGNLALYKLALRQRSAATPLTNGIKHNNERLEYLGDAVLGSIVADFLFKKFPFKDEGFLTEMRSRMVSRTNLNSLSKKLGLNKLIETNIEGKVSGSSIPGDAFEALVGAIYLDKGYRFAKKILVNQIIACHLDIEELVNKEINFKSKIIEWSQKEKKNTQFVLVEELDNGKKSKLYVVNLLIDGQIAGNGQDFSIKKAEQKAAAEAWEKLSNQGDVAE